MFTLGFSHTENLKSWNGPTFEGVNRRFANPSVHHGTFSAEVNQR